MYETYWITNASITRCTYHIAILSHIGKSLGEQCAVDGFIKYWIDMDNNTSNNNKNNNISNNN